MGKAENPGGLLETVEKIKAKYRMLKALGLEDWKAKELANSRKGYWRMAKVLNQIFSKKKIAKLGYTSMLDYYLIISKEPPYTEPYVRCCGRSVDKIIISPLPDIFREKKIYLKKNLYYSCKDFRETVVFEKTK